MVGAGVIICTGLGPGSCWLWGCCGVAGLGGRTRSGLGLGGWVGRFWIGVGGCALRSWANYSLL